MAKFGLIRLSEGLIHAAHVKVFKYFIFIHSLFYTKLFFTLNGTSVYAAFIVDGTSYNVGGTG